MPFAPLAADLPAPRDDDPPSLRQDILDELADHLDCALRRELLTHRDDAAAAEQRVRERFGDPAAVARQLWFDALKGRVMFQKLVLAACVVLAVASAVMLAVTFRALQMQQVFALAAQAQSGLLLQQLQQDAAAAAAREQQREAQFEQLTQTLEQQRSEQATLAAALREAEQARLQLEQRLAAQPAVKQEPSDWNPVEIQLVSGTAEGPPANGFRVTLRITAQETGIPTMTETSGEDGLVRFPRVRYGTYELTVTAPWETNREYHTRSVILRPGEGLQTTIVCPPQEARSYLASVAVEWPDEFKDRQIYVAFAPRDLERTFGETVWSTSGRGSSMRGGFGGPPADYGLIVAPDGTFHTAQRMSLSMIGSSRVPQIPENTPDVRLMSLLADGFAFRSDLSILVPGSSPSGPGSGRPDDVQFAGFTVRQDSAHELFRFEPGEPGRVVVLPPPAAIVLLRKEFAARDAADPSAETNSRPFRELLLQSYINSRSSRDRTGSAVSPIIYAHPTNIRPFSFEQPGF